MYFRYNNDYDYYRIAVKAYTSNIPIIVNGVNINTEPYPAINYQPNPSIPPYSYVPIAQFSKVGAEVKWDEGTKTIYVQSNCQMYKNDAIYYKQELEKLKIKYDNDTESIVTDDDKAYAESKKLTDYAPIPQIFQVGIGQQPSFTSKIDFSIYPIGTYVKYFVTMMHDSNGRPYGKTEYIKTKGQNWIEYSPF